MENIVKTGTPTRARAATLVTVGPPARLAEAAGVLAEADEAGSLRHVLISTTGEDVPDVEGLQDVTVENVRPQFLNNAVAALRLSSLPTVVWWRGGPPDRLPAVATLADRVLLDAEDSLPLWRQAPALFGRTALTDFRWARLTRWRGVMALLFDLPQVREAAPDFQRLRITGNDPAQCALFAGWLASSLDWQGRVAVELERAGASASLSKVELDGPSASLQLALHRNGACLTTEARVNGDVLTSRVLSLGSQALPSLLSEELRLRSRDIPFERALQQMAS
ncbi:hypothetical protein BH24ACI4_BH24ACI4_06310 [soil metagenome]